jgi:hypothetical protein
LGWSIFVHGFSPSLSGFFNDSSTTVFENGLSAQATAVDCGDCAKQGSSIPLPSKQRHASGRSVESERVKHDPCDLSDMTKPFLNPSFAQGRNTTTVVFGAANAETGSVRAAKK